MSTWLIVIGLILLFIGIIMLIVGIVMYENNKTNGLQPVTVNGVFVQPWWVWFLIVFGIILAIVGVVMFVWGMVARSAVIAVAPPMMMQGPPVVVESHHGHHGRPMLPAPVYQEQPIVQGPPVGAPIGTKSCSEVVGVPHTQYYPQPPIAEVHTHLRAQPPVGVTHLDPVQRTTVTGPNGISATTVQQLPNGHGYAAPQGTPMYAPPNL